MPWEEISLIQCGTIGPICESFCFASVSIVLKRPSDVSRISSIAVSAYVRTAAAVQGDNDMGNDLLMGRVDLTPVLEGHVRIYISAARY